MKLKYPDPVCPVCKGWGLRGNKPCRCQHRPSRFEVEWKWHCRPAGGLFLGLRVQFPVMILYADGHSRLSTFVSLGLLITTVCFTYRSRSKRFFEHYTEEGV